MRKVVELLKKRKTSLLFILTIGVMVPAYIVLEAVLLEKELPANTTWWQETLSTFLFTIVMTIVLYSTSTIISLQLEKRLPWKEFARKRFWLELVLNSVFTVVLATAVTLLWYYNALRTTCPNPVEMVFQVVVIAWVVNTISTAIYEAIFLFGQWKTALLNAEKLKQENLQSQFAALKNQVNPHFLFNSLNTLATIIPEDSDQAVEFVQKLSSVYRYLLQYKDDETVELKTELDCIEAYFFLQKIRFGDNLIVNITVPKQYFAKLIPPLTLQILVENAIKHNIISKQKPLHVDIYVDDAGMLVTRNNLQKKKSVESSTKIGLQNLINRFSYIFNQSIDIFETETDFLVKVPLG